VRAGDVAVLRAGVGLSHDEVAGAEGARVLQCYLRAAEPGAPAAHEVHTAASGWLDLGRPDVRLWQARVAAGDTVDPPAGLLVVAGAPAVTAGEHLGGPVRVDTEATVVVWSLDSGRPAWAATP
jgi:hypothetical protein